jgi:hypothetical protein
MAGKQGIVHAAHDQRRVSKPAVRRHRAGWFAVNGELAQVHPAVVQQRRADPAQSHQRRRAELPAIGRGFLIGKRIVGEIARKIERVELSALTFVLYCVFSPTRATYGHASHDQRIRNVGDAAQLCVSIAPWIVGHGYDEIFHE